MKQNLQNIPLNQIKFSPGNPRKKINDKSLKELAASIKANGVLQPIVVKESEDSFELIAGERRTRACLSLGFVTIPAVVRTGDDDAEVLKLQIAENLQRENVSYFEEAMAIARLRDTCDLTTAELMKAVGKSEGYVYSQLSLTRMPESVKDAMQNEWIAKGVAWEIARLPNADAQSKICADLMRTDKSERISLKHAKKHIADAFGENRVKQPKQNAAQKHAGNDYQINWKVYLVGFSAEQFIAFKRVLRGRTDTPSIQKAVERVMTA